MPQKWHSLTACGAVWLLQALAGCGPLGPQPAVVRVSPETQQKVDVAWQRLATSPAADRAMLLDCIIVQQLHQIGVDSLDMISRKQLPGGGVVEMHVRFDRLDPEVDEFIVTVFDGAGRINRQEWYAGDEVRERAEFLLNVPINHGEPAEEFEQALADEDLAPDDAESLLRQRQKRLDEIAELLNDPDDSLSSGDMTEDDPPSSGNGLQENS